MRGEIRYFHRARHFYKKPVFRDPFNQETHRAAKIDYETSES